MSRGATPKGWPHTAIYIAAAAPDPKLTKEQQRASLAAIASLTARPGCPQPQHVAAAPCPLVKITAIHDPKHPACGQHGLTAAKKLAASQFVLPYVGYFSVKPHCSTTSDYILRLAGDVALDAEVGRRLPPPCCHYALQWDQSWPDFCSSCLSGWDMSSLVACGGAARIDQLPPLAPLKVARGWGIRPYCLLPPSMCTM
jgi:hypothetical protein